MRRIQLVISYDGAAFSGFSRPGTLPLLWASRTFVQSSLETALAAFLGVTSAWPSQLPTIVGSSRTDAGVHADANSCHFDLPDSCGQRSLDAVVNGLNQKLASELGSDTAGRLAVLAARERPLDWHCRYDAAARVYRYQLAVGQPLPLGSAHWWFYRHRRSSFDVDSLRRAAQLLVGRGVDFSAFQSVGCRSPSPTKDMHSVDVVEVPPPVWAAAASQPPLFLQLRFQASGFLYRQVRNMVGLLCEVGRGKISVDQFQHVLDTKTRAPIKGVHRPIAPPQGLSLERVLYTDELY